MNYFSIERKMMGVCVWGGGGGGRIFLLSLHYATPFYKIQKPKTGLINQKPFANYICKINVSFPEVLNAENV